MPVFEFTCDQCGKRFDKLFRTVSGEPQAICPACGSKKTHRALSLVNAGESRGGSASGDAAPFCPCGKPGGSCGMN